MGVRGLQTFLCGNPERNFAGLPNGEKKINMREKIQRYIREKGTAPILVIDASGIISLIAKNEGELFCGGRHQRYYELFGNLFAELKSCGAKLVFFRDLNVQESRSALWLSRRNDEYDDSIGIFQKIDAGWTVSQILRSRKSPQALMTARHALNSEAKRHGEFFPSTKHDCDVELIKYARDHKALAVIGNDSDFLIFDGDFEYWSAYDIDVDNLTTIEYNRNALRLKIGLTYKQMPLLATLMTNDYTSSVSGQLYSFHCGLGRLADKWLNVAAYVRTIGPSAFSLTEADIRRVSKRVFGYGDSMETREMLRNGIESYNLDFVVEKETDPLLLKTVHQLDVFKQLTSPILTLTITMYDMRKKSSEKTYTEIMAELLRKSVGILWKQKNTKYKFQLYAKWSHMEKWTVKTETPIFPPNELKLPPLIELLFKEDSDAKSELNQTRWKLLTWLLSFKDIHAERIQSVPMEFRLIATTLLYMIKQGQITESEADAILFTEKKVRNDEVGGYETPQKLVTRSVHVAHLYGKIYRKIRSAFAVTGLGASIDKAFKFDGVAFHHIRSKFLDNPQEISKYSSEITDSQIYI